MVTGTSWTAAGPSATRRRRTRPATSPTRATTPCPPSPLASCRAAGGRAPVAPAGTGGQGGQAGPRRSPERGTARTPSPTPPGTKGETDAGRRPGRAPRGPRLRNTASITSAPPGPPTLYGRRRSRSSGITSESLTGVCAASCSVSALSLWSSEF